MQGVASSMIVTLRNIIQTIVGRVAKNNHECREHIARILAEGALVVSGVACK